MVDVPLFVFIDESGDFNFSPSGSEYFTLTALITLVPSEASAEISELKHRILSKEKLSMLTDTYLERRLAHRFHATEDKQVVRDEVFALISSMKYFKAHSVIVQKNKTNPSLYSPHKFYPLLTSSLIDYVCKSYKFSKLVIITDSMPVTSRREAFLKAMKTTISFKSVSKPYSLYCPPSHSNYFLQIADYVNWAIFKKWESKDTRSYEIIKKFLGKTELDYFRTGTKIFYKK